MISYIRINYEYFDINVGGIFVLAAVMSEFRCKILVFSSSATVYSEPHTVPIKEDFPLSVTSPYGRSKLMKCAEIPGVGRV